MDTLVFKDHTSESEKAKIHCAKEHFKKISDGNYIYDVVDSYQSLLDKVMK